MWRRPPPPPLLLLLTFSASVPCAGTAMSSAWEGRYTQVDGTVTDIVHDRQRDGGVVAAHSTRFGFGPKGERGTLQRDADGIERLHMSDTVGEMRPVNRSSSGHTIVWSNGARWARECHGGCPPLDCATACRDPGLRGLLSMFASACVEFVPDEPTGEARFHMRPCAATPTSCPPGETLEPKERACIHKYDDTKHWDLWHSRAKMIAHFLGRTNARPTCGPRIAVLTIADYDPNAGGHFSNATSLAGVHSRCVASLTWQAENRIAPGGSATGKPLGHAASRPIMIPDPYFLMTDAYSHEIRYFHGRFNATRASLAAAAERLPWNAKRSSVVWRGTQSSDSGGDRLRLMTASEQLVKMGTFTAQQLDVAFSECSKETQTGLCGPLYKEDFPDRDRFLSAEQMVEARGIISVDGIGNEWTLPWKLLANSVCVLVESTRTWQWYYPLLRPWVHYVPVKPDMSDLASAIAYVLDPNNDDALQRIARASTELATSLTVASAAAGVREQLEATFNPVLPDACAGQGDEACACWTRKCTLWARNTAERLSAKEQKALAQKHAMQEQMQQTQAQALMQQQLVQQLEWQKQQLLSQHT